MNSLGTLSRRSCLWGHADVVYCNPKFTCIRHCTFSNKQALLLCRLLRA
jgi:hypothetical protein